jgi:uncharacterized protein with PQ loop repeat
MSYEFLHVHKRKHENEPAKKEPTVLMGILDKIAYPVAIVVPLSSLDQVIRMWVEKSAVGVSPILWIMLFLTSMFWITYASVHKVRVILVGHLVWFVLSSAVLIQMVLFS